jgi:hypothetical protein
LCLLGSWIRRYSADKEKIWKMLIDFKYRTDSPNILTCSNAGGGPIFGRGSYGLLELQGWGTSGE